MIKLRNVIWFTAHLQSLSPSVSPPPVQPRRLSRSLSKSMVLLNLLAQSYVQNQQNTSRTSGSRLSQIISFNNTISTNPSASATSNNSKQRCQWHQRRLLNSSRQWHTYQYVTQKFALCLGGNKKLQQCGGALREDNFRFFKFFIIIQFFQFFHSFHFFHLFHFL